MSDDAGARLSNWGRWGADDERGCLNLLTPEAVRSAAGLVRTGEAFSLAAPLAADGPQFGAFHRPWRVTDYGHPPQGMGGAVDTLIIHTHSGTHIDPLCHTWHDDMLYNGFRASEHVSSAGSRRCGVDKIPHMVGRGVLLDIARWKGVACLGADEPVTADDLAGCAAAQGVSPRPGDIVLLRTGWIERFAEDPARYGAGEPGIDTSALPWLRDHDIVAVGADNWGVEVQTPGPLALPVHKGMLRDLGAYLLENLALAQLAERRAYEFLLVVAPLRLPDGVGSPINPVAII